MVRGHATVRTALIAAGLLLLAGCSQDPAGLPTSVDYERAERVWSDPWLAPGTASVPEAGWGSPDGYVRRDAGTRTTRYTAGSPQQALQREIASAQDAGWILTGLVCDGLTASLARGTGLDDGAIAVLEVAAAGRGAEVVVTGYVPHHLDGSWPAPSTDPAFDGSCRNAAGQRPLADDVSLGEPFDGGEEPAEPDTTTWQRESPSDEEQALLDAVNADPWVAGLGLVLDSELAADDTLRRAPTADATATDALLADVVADMAGWELTWMSCGRGRATEATARLVTDDGVAVARLTGLPDRTDVTVTLPLPEAPPPDWIADVPALNSPACLTSTPRHRRIVIQGTPVTTVAESQPVAG